MRRRALLAFVLLAGCGGLTTSDEIVDGSTAVDGATADGSHVGPSDTDRALDAVEHADTSPPPLSDAAPTTPACIDCNISHCDTLARACDDNPVCAKQSFCRQACVDDECAAKCRETFPSPLYDPWWKCIHDACAGPCGF